MNSDPAKKIPAFALASAVVAAGLCINGAVAIWALRGTPGLNSDFRGLWSFAEFAQHRPLSQIYLAAPLQAFQDQIYRGFRSFFPYQYPPSFLLPLRLLGSFRYATAQTLWTFAGLGSLITAGWLAFPPKHRCFAILALLAAPASLLNGAAGETGYFTAAMLLAGFAWLPERPVAAGIVFGLLTIKPQLGALIPFALLGRADTRAIYAACGTAAALAGTSCIFFPPRLWTEWLHAVLLYQAQYSSAASSLGLNADVTLAGNFMRLGVQVRLAWGAQLLTSFGGAVMVFFAFRRGPYRLAVAALMAGTCLCAPHACAYDSIALTAAILALQPQSASLIGLCLVLYLSPYLLLTAAAPWFLYAIPETLLFIAIIYLAFTAERPPDIRHEPDSAAKSKPNQR